MGKVGKMTPKDFEARKVRSAERKRKLAQKLDDEPMLIAALRFYLGALLPTRTAVAGSVLEQTYGMNLKWKRHLLAARRILGLMWRDRGKTLRLPANYLERLQRIGLDLLTDFDTRSEFFALDTYLEIDEAVTAFTFFHPVLLAAKSYLSGDQWSEAERRFKPELKLTLYSQCLQNHVMEELALRRHS
jgi:hypothetical protein